MNIFNHFKNGDFTQPFSDQTAQNIFVDMVNVTMWSFWVPSRPSLGHSLSFSEAPTPADHVVYE